MRAFRVTRDAETGFKDRSVGRVLVLVLVQVGYRLTVSFA